jgi:hypothetical protein
MPWGRQLGRKNIWRIDGEALGSDFVDARNLHCKYQPQLANCEPTSSGSNQSIAQRAAAGRHSRQNCV